VITVITRWESTQMKPELEWRMWRQLRGAFDFRDIIFVPRLPKMDGYDFRQADTIEEALAVLPEHTERVFLEPTGNKPLTMLPDRLNDVVFILGNTAMSNLKQAEPDETYHIHTPQQTDLYGINAAAIALSYWVGQ